MSIQQEIDRYFYQYFTSFRRVEGEEDDGIVRVSMGNRDNIPVADWAVVGKAMSRENLISFAKYFYNLGAKQGK